ncbi:hypothetical protein [Chelativorans sp. AA-79]|uniref:hypothetical protein n=1 Tax=Chelativorans sp. AA-79 TaxID=3028735 RepID=UPI0023F7AECE|nr:hypothetical protein [Chelativorans sp. AA-79]WEX09659.1 hypothetical protein PVE73_01415 [Chelativorans sp. AA-79]
MLEKNPDHVNFRQARGEQGPFYMKGSVIIVEPEPQARLATLKTGEVHIAELPFDDVPAL